MPSPLYCRLDQIPPSADQFIYGVAPSITARFFSSCPSDSTSRWTPCPPENCEAWLQVRLGCIRLSSLCPFRLLHTFRFLRPATYYRRFWIQRSSSERRRDLNPPDQCAAQRKVNAGRFHSHRADPAPLKPISHTYQILRECVKSTYRLRITVSWNRNEDLCRTDIYTCSIWMQNGQSRPHGFVLSVVCHLGLSV